MEYNEFNAVISIEDMTIRNEKLPPKAAGLVIEWALAHKDELSADWEMAQKDQKLSKIEPLK